MQFVEVEYPDLKHNNRVVDMNGSGNGGGSRQPIGAFHRDVIFVGVFIRMGELYGNVLEVLLVLRVHVIVHWMEKINE